MPMATPRAAKTTKIIVSTRLDTPDRSAALANAVDSHGGIVGGIVQLQYDIYILATCKCCFVASLSDLNALECCRVYHGFDKLMHDCILTYEAASIGPSASSLRAGVHICIYKHIYTHAHTHTMFTDALTHTRTQMDRGKRTHTYR